TFPDIRPLVGNPWTVLHVNPPAKDSATIAAVDIPERFDSLVRRAVRQERSQAGSTNPAWHGTILPKTDADIWLTTAFAEYERVVARENSMEERHKAGDS